MTDHWRFKRISLICCAAVCMLALWSTSIGQPWRVEFHAHPGISLYNLAAATNADGNTVFACTEWHQSIDLFQVSAQGQVIWSIDDDVSYSHPGALDHTPLQVMPLPDGGWGILLLQEFFNGDGDPIGRALFLSFSSAGALRYTAVACDSSSDAYVGGVSATIVGNMAFVVWGYLTSGGIDARYQRISLQDGTVMESPYGHVLVSGSGASLASTGDSCIISARDSIYVLNSGGEQLGTVSANMTGLLATRGQEWFLYGGRQASDHTLLLARFLSGILQSTDTVDSGLQQNPAGQFVVSQDTLFLFYELNDTSYVRRYCESFVSNEDTVTFGDGMPSLVSLDSARIAVAWMHRLPPYEIRVQEWDHGWRWLEALEIDSINVSGGQWERPRLSAYGGACVVSWISDGILYAQPPDTTGPTRVRNPMNSKALRLLAVAPNPTNGTVEIIYDVGAVNRLTMEVRNLLGERVTTLLNNVTESPGSHHLFWTPQAASGSYFITLRTPHALLGQKKLIYLK